MVTPWRFDDARAWSGMIARMAAALSEVAEIIPVSTAAHPTSRIDRLATRTLSMASNKGYLWDFGIATAVSRGRTLRRRLHSAEPDVVLGLVSSTDLAFAGALDAPVVQVSDATLAAMHNFYPQFTNLHPLSLWQAEFVTNRSIRATDAFVVSSQWAIDSLVRDYAVGTHQCVLAPTGPGIDPPEGAVQRGTANGALSALLVSTNWDRKGGDIAVEAVRRARESGTRVELTVVGDAPTDLPEWVNLRGRLDTEALSREYLHADVLLELARANAAGVTLTDAAAHSLPAIAAAVGGVSSIVVDRETGVLLDVAAATNEGSLAHAAADALTQLSNPDLRASMGQAAHTRWKDHLNWDEWARRVIAACGIAHVQWEARQQ